MNNKIIFYVGSKHLEEPRFPNFYLAKAKWDDYGLLTSFTLYYQKNDRVSRQLIGTVKIASVGQVAGRTALPSDFPTLESRYFSLGQTNSYYDKLDELGESVKNQVLLALNDVTKSNDAMRVAESERSYSLSLTRFLGALALANLKNSANDTSLTLTFESRLHSAPLATECQFKFKSNSIIPANINALIGVNGAGKTQLLANFVSGLLGLGENKIEVFGRDRVKKVIVVSYSIFDRFFLPGQISVPANRSRKEHITEELRYAYIGLREKVSDSSDLTKIAGPVAFARRFTNALQQLQKDERYGRWAEIMAPILHDSDFSDDNDLTDNVSRARFRRLGAGHKATLSMLTSLYSELIDGSLVVIDEPENHLHPSLLSTFLHVFRAMLKDTNSFGVISTHSPVVIQEIPAKCVKVVSKIDGQTSVIPLRIESFGTSVDTLTNEIFGLSFEMPSYVHVLHDLAQRSVALNEVEDELGKPLSTEARSYYLSMMSE